MGIVVYLQRKNDIPNPQNIITMKEIIEKVAAAYAVFSKDAGLQAEQGNKAVGLRAALLRRHGIALVVVAVAAAWLAHKAYVVKIRRVRVVRIEQVDPDEAYRSIPLRNNYPACVLPVGIVLVERKRKAGAYLAIRSS